MENEGRDEIYKAPDVAVGLPKEEARRAGKALKSFGVTVSVLLGSMGFIEYLDEGIDFAIGAFFGNLIPAAVVVVIFQIGKRFRNNFSRWRIYTTMQCLFLVSEFSRYMGYT